MRRRRTLRPAAPTPQARAPAEPRARRRPTQRTLLLQLLGLLALLGCGKVDVVNGVEDRQANDILVALDQSGVRAEKRRGDGGESSGWSIAVAEGDAPRARRVLADHELPRPRPAGFGEVFGKGSMVPTPTEERAMYLHALAGEVARSVEAIDDVLEARVHLALAPPDPLRSEAPPPSRAAVLVKVRAGARTRLEPLAPGVQSIVAGAVAGLHPDAVSVVIIETVAAAVHHGVSSPWRRPLLVAAGLAALVALGMAASAVRAAWSTRRSRASAS